MSRMSTVDPRPAVATSPHPIAVLVDREGLGDLLLKLPMLRAIARGFPGRFFAQLITAYAAAGMRPAARHSRVIKALRTFLPRWCRNRLFPADNGVALFKSWAKRQAVRLSAVRFARGDCLFVPGSFWTGKYAPRLAARANAAGVPVTAFVYDLLPLSHPDWLEQRRAKRFRRGRDSFLPGCAAIVCLTAYTRDELRRLVVLPRGLPVYTC